MCKNDIDNYLLSSGIKVFLDKLSIADYFKEIYATTFFYDDNNEVCDIKFLMSDKNKVDVIKNILSNNNIDENDCSNIIYIGDGLTDYYAMEFVKKYNGITVFVYTDSSNKDLLTMQENDIVSFYAKADFSSDSELYRELYRYIKKCEIN